MSMEALSILSSGLKIDLNAEKDAQVKKAEEAVGDSFATLLAQQAGPASNVTTISGQRNSTVIPASLIDIASDDGTDIQMAEASSNGTAVAKDATETFLDFASKTPAEKMRAMVLADMGLTEEDLRSLSAEDRAELEAKIRTQIEVKVKQEIEKKSGFNLSQSFAVP